MQASVCVILCATCCSPGRLSLARTRTLSNGLPKCQMIHTSDTLHPYTLSHAIKLMASAPLPLKFMLSLRIQYFYVCMPHPIDSLLLVLGSFCHAILDAPEP